MCNVTSGQANNEEKGGYGYTELLVIKGHQDGFCDKHNEGCASVPPVSKRSDETHNEFFRSLGVSSFPGSFADLFCLFLFYLELWWRSQDYIHQARIIPLIWSWAPKGYFFKIFTYTLLSTVILWLLWGISKVSVFERWNRITSSRSPLAIQRHRISKAKQIAGGGQIAQWLDRLPQKWCLMTKSSL